MAMGLLLLTFFAFHGTSGNQTENNINIFLVALNVLQQDRFGSSSDYLLYRLDCLVYHLNHYSPVLELDNVILITVHEARMALLSLHEHSPVDVSSTHKVGVAFSGVPGRPLYVISREHLLFFLDHPFTIPKIAVLLGVSPSTVKRRLRQYGWPAFASYAVMADEDLDQIVSAIVNDFPNCGYKRMTGFLL